MPKGAEKIPKWVLTTYKDIGLRPKFLDGSPGWLIRYDYEWTERYVDLYGELPEFDGEQLVPEGGFDLIASSMNSGTNAGPADAVFIEPVDLEDLMEDEADYFHIYFFKVGDNMEKIFAELDRNMRSAIRAEWHPNKIMRKTDGELDRRRRREFRP